MDNTRCLSAYPIVQPDFMNKVRMGENVAVLVQAFLPTKPKRPRCLAIHTIISISIVKCNAAIISFLNQGAAHNIHRWYRCNDGIGVRSATVVCKPTQRAAL